VTSLGAAYPFVPAQVTDLAVMSSHVRIYYSVRLVGAANRIIGVALEWYSYLAALQLGVLSQGARKFNG
jgi:hypothetical protein